MDRYSLDIKLLVNGKTNCMNISAENEIKLKVSPQEKIRVFLYQLFFSSFEMLALTLFIFARTFDLDIVQRIFLGGAVTVFSTVLYIFVKFRVSPLYFSTNVFFVFASAMLLVNVGGIGEFFLFLREIGMFLFIFVISQETLCETFQTNESFYTS